MFGFKPNSSAAPPAPAIFQPACSESALEVGLLEGSQLVIGENLCTTIWNHEKPHPKLGLACVSAPGPLRLGPRSTARLHHVLELAHVAWPVVRHEGLEILAAQADRSAGVMSLDRPREEMIGQGGDVVFAMAQWR